MRMDLYTVIMWKQEQFDGDGEPDPDSWALADPIIVKADDADQAVEAARKHLIGSDASFEDPEDTDRVIKGEVVAAKLEEVTSRTIAWDITA